MFARHISSSIKLATLRPVSVTSSPTRAFTTSLARMVQVGDPIPDVDLTENSPGNPVNLHKSLTGKGLIIGVPAAFSPSCSDTHIPGYIHSAKTKSAGDVYVISVNDAFVMKAWGKTLDPENSSKIHFLADASGAFTNALDLGFDAKAVLGNVRSKRYALVVDGGKVQKAHVEPDNTGVKESAVETVLGA